eukprot:Pgem_evm3s10330
MEVNSKDFVEKMNKVLTSTTNAINCLGLGEAPLFKNIIAMLDALLTPFKLFVKNYPTYYSNCATSSLEYLAGMSCFACDADGSNYISESNNIGVILSLDTCTNLAHNCGPVWNSLDELAHGVIDTFKKFQSTLAIPVDGIQLPSKLSDQELCDVMLN